MELAIDTSNEVASVAVSSEGVLVAELTWRSGQNHTVELMPNIICLLRQAALELGDLRGLVVARGPGSFNGLRVAMSVAKGLALALNLPLVGVGTLEVEAYPYRGFGLPVCAVMAMGRGELASAVYEMKRGEWVRTVEERISPVDSLAKELDSRTLFCGGIPADVVSQLKRSLGTKALVLGDGTGARRAGYLAELGWRRLQRGDFDPSPTLQPLYLRRPSITASPKVGGL